MRRNPSLAPTSRLALAAAALSLAGPVAAEPITAAEVERSGDHLQITWTSEAPVDVYVADEPDAPRDERALVSRADADGKHAVSVAATDRPYVWLEPRDGEAIWVAERVLPLEGGRNFRDMGGYETADGKRVVWGSIYRSGVMHRFTEQDYALLGDLGISVICDLRSALEREREPTQWERINASLDYRSWNEPQATQANSANGQSQSLMGEPVQDPEVARKRFKDYYRYGVYEFADRYSAIFHELIDGNAPLAFNCSAGKDRAGRMAALLLTALGVPRETVVADYAMSDDVVDFVAEFSDRDDGPEDEDSPYAILEQWSPEAVAVLLSSEPEFINAMFDQIETDYGTVERFLAEELDVDETDLARLRALYLEG